MPAIITDQYRILNAETFIDSFVGIGTIGNNNYYTFLGHPNPELWKKSTAIYIYIYIRTPEQQAFSKTSGLRH